MSITFEKVEQKDKSLNTVKYRFYDGDGEPGIQIFDEETEEWYHFVWIDREGVLQISNDYVHPAFQTDELGFIRVEK